MKLVAGLLAAGASSRFGDVKQLQDVEGQSMVNRTLGMLHKVGIEDVILVLGANSERISQQLDASVNWVENEDWAQGIGRSLATLVKRLPVDVSHVLVCLSDQLAIEAEQIRLLIERAKRHQDNIVAAEYAQTVGVPAIFPRQYFPCLAELNGDQGAKKVIYDNLKQVVRVELPAAAIDIDTKQDLANWRTYRQKHR